MLYTAELCAHAGVYIYKDHSHVVVISGVDHRGLKLTPPDEDYQSYQCYTIEFCSVYKHMDNCQSSFALISLKHSYTYIDDSILASKRVFE